MGECLGKRKVLLETTPSLASWPSGDRDRGVPYTSGQGAPQGEQRRYRN